MVQNELEGSMLSHPVYSYIIINNIELQVWTSMVDMVVYRVIYPEDKILYLVTPKYVQFPITKMDVVVTTNSTW